MMRTRLGTVLVLTAVVFSPRVVAEDDKKAATTAAVGLPSATEVFQKAQKAVKAVKLFRYRAEYKAEGWVSEFVANVEGSVIVGQQSEQGVERFSCQVKIKPPKSEDTLEFSAGSDGDNYFLVDSKTKTVHEDMDPAALGSQSRNIRRAVMTELGVSEPFSKELKAEKSEVKGISKVGEEDCFEVYAAMPGALELTWFLSKKDLLPRRVKRLLKNPEGKEATTELTLVDFAADPADVKDPFRVVVPEGYKKTNDFAP